MSFLSCVFMALLVITPVGELDRFEDPEIRGTCLVDAVMPFVWIDQQRHTLNIILGKFHYVLPLPPKIGQERVVYRLGDDFAEMGAWGRVMVRKGPTEMY